MAKKGTSLDRYVDKWNTDIKAVAAQKDQLLRCFYKISKEADELLASGFSYATVLNAVARLFIEPHQNPVDGSSRATQLMRMQRMSDSLIEFAAERIKQRAKGSRFPTSCC